MTWRIEPPNGERSLIRTGLCIEENDRSSKDGLSKVAHEFGTSQDEESPTPSPQKWLVMTAIHVCTHGNAKQIMYMASFRTEFHSKMRVRTAICCPNSEESWDENPGGWDRSWDQNLESWDLFRKLGPITWYLTWYLTQLLYRITELGPKVGPKLGPSPNSLKTVPTHPVRESQNKNFGPKPLRIGPNFGPNAFVTSVRFLHDFTRF